MPVGARLLQARISATASASLSTSTGYLRPLLAGSKPGSAGLVGASGRRLGVGCRFDFRFRAMVCISL